MGRGRNFAGFAGTGLAVLAGVFFGVKAFASLVAAGFASAGASAPDWQASNEREMTRTDKIDTFFMGVVYSLFCRGRKGLSGASDAQDWWDFDFPKLLMKRPKKSRMNQ